MPVIARQFKQQKALDMKIQQNQGVMKLIQRDYPDLYQTLNWIDPDMAQRIEEKRTCLLEQIEAGPDSAWAFSGTKPHIGPLSPGCVLCGEGKWSCLFINGICNASCFYCPSAQNNPGPPMTNTLEFENAEDYAGYVERFGIRGISFSGGEPLLAFDRVMEYLEAVKKNVPYPVYAWMYTNGILSGSDKFKKLRDAGLDEIRFDLSADDYRLKGIAQAIGVIPRVTIEIPAIPEDLPRVKKMLRQWEQMGVSHLNLHQIRCTPYNIRRLSQRGYHFSWDEGITVPETELAALDLIASAQQDGCSLPIQYCAYKYRRQFQGAAVRKRYAALVQAGHEDLTETGHIRRLSLAGPLEILEKNRDTFVRCSTDPARYSLSGGKDRLMFSAGLWPLVDFTCSELTVFYSAACIKPSVSYRNPFKTIQMRSGKGAVIEKQAAHQGLRIADDLLPWFGRLISQETADPVPAGTGCPERDDVDAILKFEKICSGLSVY